MDYSKCTYISWHKYDESPEIKVYEGDILLVKTGSSYGKCALVSHLPKEATINPQFVVIKNISINPEYLTCVLQSEYARRLYEGFVLGTAIPTFTQEKLGNMLLPLPPIGEQKGIVATINEFNLHISNIENKKEELSDSIALSKSKILEFAMQGKLVPQDPTDEPAADMLRRINPRARIITDNPHSRNIPEGWCVTALSDLCVFLSRGKSPKYSDIPNQYPVFAQKCNLKEDGISLDQARFLDEATLDKWPVKYRLKTGDVLINSTGTGTVGRTRYFDDCCLGAYPFTVPDSHVSVVRSFDEINSKYLFYCLYSPNIQQYFEDNLAGSTNQKELYIDIIGSTQIVLPPVSEQQRIVLKIEALYYVLDKIEASLQS